MTSYASTKMKIASYPANYNPDWNLLFKKLQSEGIKVYEGEEGVIYRNKFIPMEYNNFFNKSSERLPNYR